MNLTEQNIMFKHLLAVFATTAFALVAQAQTNSSITLNPWSDGQFGQTADKALYQEQGHVKGEDDRGAQVFWWDSTGRFRFSTHDDNAFTLGYRYLMVNFDTNSRNVPDTLDDLSLAAGIHLGEINGWHSSLVAGAGYSGDNLFASEDGLYGIAHVLFEREINESDSLVLGVGYDGSSSLFPDLPYPEFAYRHADPGLSFSIGYPYSSAHWNLAPKLAMDVNYTAPFSGDVTLEYQLGSGFSVFGNYSNFFNAFFQQEERREDRIFYEMRRAELGVRYFNENAYKGMALDAAIVIGYAFEQQLSEGWDVRDRDPVAELSDEPYIGVVLRGTF